MAESGEPWADAVEVNEAPVVDIGALAQKILDFGVQEASIEGRVDTDALTAALLNCAVSVIRRIPSRTRRMEIELASLRFMLRNSGVPMSELAVHIAAVKKPGEGHG